MTEKKEDSIISVKEFVDKIGESVKKHFVDYVTSYGWTTHEQRYSIMERYGIATHQQYYNLIQKTSIHINNSGHYGQIGQILRDMRDEVEFKSGAYYFAEIIALCDYRFPAEVDRQINELLPVINEAIKFRLVENQGDCEKSLISLGLLVFQNETIPFLLKLTDDIGYKYWFSSHRHDYYTNYRPCIIKYIGLLEAEMEKIMEKITPEEKEHVQKQMLWIWEKIARYTEMVLELN